MVNTDFGKSLKIPIQVREIRPEDFVLTRSEWSSDNREQVFRSRSNITSTETLFTVPSGRFLFITAAWIVMSNSTQSIKASRININDSANNFDIINVGVSQMIGQQGNPIPVSSALSYNMPIKVPPENIIVMISDGAHTSGGFQAWLE